MGSSFLSLCTLSAAPGWRIGRGAARAQGARTALAPYQRCKPVHCARRCCWDPAAQVRAAAAKHLSDPALIQENINDHAVVRREINKHLEEAKGQKSVGTARHLEQQASLIGGMAKEGLIQDGCCYIEFGAGRGKLLHWLGQAAKELAAGGASAVPGQAGKST